MTPRVLLMRLSIRESAKGTPYLSGFLGCARVVAFMAKETDKFGNEQWEVFLSEPEPKDGQRQQPTRGQSTWNATRDHDLPEGRTVIHKNERRTDPREEYIRELSDRFGPDTEIPF